jgi:gas vesicle protein
MDKISQLGKYIPDLACLCIIIMHHNKKVYYGIKFSYSLGTLLSQAEKNECSTLNRKIMNAKHLIGGIFAGVAVGAAIGILLAPASGTKTRMKLQDGSRKLMDELRSNVEELKDKYNHSVDEIASRGKAGISAVREKVKV